MHEAIGRRARRVLGSAAGLINSMHGGLEVDEHLAIVDLLVITYSTIYRPNRSMQHFEWRCVTFGILIVCCRDRRPSSGVTRMGRRRSSNAILYAPYVVVVSLQHQLEG